MKHRLDVLEQKMASFQQKRVELKTVTVEIRALSVGGRQLTQAIFNQLPVTKLFDIYDGVWTRGLEDDGEYEILGDVWGYVRHPSTREQWLIFTCDEKLCRWHLEGDDDLADFSLRRHKNWNHHQRLKFRESLNIDEETSFLKTRIRVYDGLEQLFIAT